MSIFNFEYKIEPINNEDGTKSRFEIVYGQNGNVIHTKKNTYKIISVEAINKLSKIFEEKGKKVSGFIHRYGEVLGIQIKLSENRKTIIGDKSYTAIIKIPNNGTGRGYLSIFEERLVCKNGAVRSTQKTNSIKIPHTYYYEDYLNLAEQTLLEFENIIVEIEQKDAELNSKTLSTTELRFKLNEWFYNNEYSDSHRKEISFDSFRRDMVLNPDVVPMNKRYSSLLESYEEEISNNTKLNLDLSHYTFYAIVTNYLSKRIKKSKSKAPEYIKNERVASKIQNISLVS